MGNSLSLQLLWKEPELEGFSMVSTNVLYICKTASLRCVAKHRNSNGPNVPVWLHESYIIFPHSTLSSFTGFSCARAPKKTLDGFPSLFMSWWSPRIVTFWMSYTKRHGKSTGAGWRLMFLSRFLLGKRRQVNLESMFFSKQPCGRWIRWRVAIPPLRSGVVVMGNGDTRSMSRFKEWLQRNRVLIWFHSFGSAWIEAPVDSCVYKHIEMYTSSGLHNVRENQFSGPSKPAGSDSAASVASLSSWSLEARMESIGDTHEYPVDMCSLEALSWASPVDSTLCWWRRCTCW